MIQYNSCPCIKLNDLWIASYRFFKSTQSHQVDINLLAEILNKDMILWAFFSKEELISTIEKYNNLLIPEPDNLSWRHIKMIVKDKEYITKLINIANACIDLDYWLFHFKMLTTVVIPKPNKTFYDLPKSFCPIILLNTMGKIFKKIIGERLQFHLIFNNLIHLY